MNNLTFTTNQNVPMLVRIVTIGQNYGRDNVLTNDGNEPLVEFFDTRYSFYPKKAKNTALQGGDESFNTTHVVSI